MIAVVDYGIGNIGSIQNMLKKTGEKEVKIADTPAALRESDKLILPGVGAFDAGMTLLDKSGMREELDYQVLTQHKPILGICLGMQMLGKGSEEGEKKGLCYVDFRCLKFDFDKRPELKVPHMGWDYIKITDKENKLVKDFYENSKFYFVHSYYAACYDSSNVVMTCNYGHEFPVAVCKENIYGVQFHPEKSHKYGLKLLQNFARL